MNAFNRDLLASHIRTCVVKDIREGKDEVIDELVLTLQKLMNKPRTSLFMGFPAERRFAQWNNTT